jgi:hypothetical protein
MKSKLKSKSKSKPKSILKDKLVSIAKNNFSIDFDVLVVGIAFVAIGGGGFNGAEQSAFVVIGGGGFNGAEQKN